MRGGLPFVVVLLAVVAAASAYGGEVGTSALWTVRDDGSNRQLLTALPAGTVLDRAANRVALRTDDGLVISALDGSGRVLLADTKGVGDAAFSPSGRSIAYTAWANGSYGLYVAGSDGTGIRLVDAAASLAAWLPDESSIVFASGAEGARADLVTELVDGSGRRVLVRRGVADSAFRPSISPDGRSIAYECLNVHGGGFCIRRGRTIARYPGSGVDPLWSPTGRAIAATVAGNYNSGLDVTDLATHARRVIAPIPKLIGVDFTPLAWSPNGRQLLYQRTCAGLRPPQCVTAVYNRTIATAKDRRVSTDGLRWTLAHWHGHTIGYVTQP
jgi:Tol biopolymer transport system component